MSEKIGQTYENPYSKLKKVEMRSKSRLSSKPMHWSQQFFKKPEGGRYIG